MLNIQKTLDSLQPHVIGIRYVESIPLVDAVFKEGWTIITDDTIKMVEGDKSMNYYMLYGQTPNIGIDELLKHVDKIIKLNVEREKKHEYLKERVNELKQVFKNNSLDKLKTLTFVFKEDKLVEKTDEIDDLINEDLNTENDYVEEQVSDVFVEPETIGYIEDEIEDLTPKEYLDNNGNKIQLTEEELEIIEEEERGKRNLEFLKNKKIELPPRQIPIKKEIKNQEFFTNTNENDCLCDHSKNEACNKCIHTIDL